MQICEKSSCNDGDDALFFAHVRTCGCSHASHFSNLASVKRLRDEYPERKARREQPQLGFLLPASGRVLFNPQFTSAKGILSRGKFCYFPLVSGLSTARQSQRIEQSAQRPRHKLTNCGTRAAHTGRRSQAHRVRRQSADAGGYRPVVSRLPRLKSRVLNARVVRRPR